jgi:SAM-dependent methyltransferase
VGAGPGRFAEHVRWRRPDLRWVASDLVATPWNDLVADALRLPFRESTFDAVVGVDLIHHLARPAAFFTEAVRVSKPGGALSFVEPWVTAFSYPIYRWLHQEGCRLSLDPWKPFGEDVRGKDAFQGDGAVVFRLVRTTKDACWRELGLDPPRIAVFNAFAYLLTLGFRRGSLLPPALLPALLGIDRATVPLSPWLGLRVHVTWTRAADAPRG